ncbi:gamma-glutamyltransferase [Opitutus sp. ER46]|uniref:gamma-glutamyltransferase n=1 Tax=Opitutus sp. ER46 TaxID=2161864 RepID=UPI001E58B834|nr:gamma-glutamyltransferase [Opitutus sp. ER46]
MIAPAFALLVLIAAPLHAQRAAVEARHGMVASAHVLASRAGVEMLERGGNAVDAAVATGLALAVVYPIAGNLGGGGFMLIHLADGRDLVIDYRETAPASAGRDMYLDANGNVREGLGSSTVGWRASGVPGTVAGFALALQKYGSGKVTWADACEPARRLAAEGFVVSQATARRLHGNRELLAQFPESKRIFLRDGAYWATGDKWKQPDLAATFARLQQQGPGEFYTGETATRIAEAMAANGGTITRADLKAYVPAERVPLRGRYRGHEIVTMPPPSSGGIALLQMLAMLEPFDVATMGPNSAAKAHLFAEVMRRAFCDRSEYLGDPDFVAVPTRELLASDYLAGRMRDFDPRRATPSSAVKPGLGPVPARDPRPGESPETTHFSVVDAAGNAVANTYTLNGNFGSGVTIPGTGVLMNNEMDDFTAKIGVRNMFGLLQGERNTIAPGRRPLSSMTPTFVFRDGRLLLVTGSPGGPTIINTVLMVITNVVDHGMPVAQAVEAPRLHHQWMPDVLTYERYGMSGDSLAVLTALGQTVHERRSYEGAYQGDAETILIDPKTSLRLGAADPRSADAAAVGH